MLCLLTKYSLVHTFTCFLYCSVQASYNDQDDKYDEDDKEVAEALGLEKENEEDVQRSVTSPPQEERKELLWPEPPDVFPESKGMVNEGAQQR